MKKGILKVCKQGAIVLVVIALVAPNIFASQPKMQKEDTALEVASTSETTYPDGTMKGDSSGAEAFGFKTDREGTSSEIRGNELPTGTDNTLGMVPMELAVVDNQGKKGTIRTYNFENDKLETKLIQDKAMNVSTVGMGRANMCKTLPADIDGDGKDEIVYYNADITRDSYDKNFVDIIVDIIDCNTGQKKYDAKVASLPLDGPFMDSINKQCYSSIMQASAGDLDGDKKDEIVVYVPYLGGKTESQTQNVIIYKVLNDRLTPVFTYNISQDTTVKYNAVNITVDDCDNDGMDEAVFTYTDSDTGVESIDKASKLSVIHYNKNTKTYGVEQLGTIKVGQYKDPMGYASVTIGDVDNDGYNELVVGGYMVNKNTQGNKYNYNGKTFNYYHELAMAYMEYDRTKQKFTGNYEGFTVFRDDEKTAATNGSSLKNHNLADTSLYLQDSEDKISMSHYTNTVNWTIPLQAVSLSGYQNNLTSDQVFFGMWFYQYSKNKGQFEVYSKITPYAYADNNNVDVANMTAGIFTKSTPPSDGTPGAWITDGKEELFMSVSRDQDSKHGTDVAYEMYCFTQTSDNPSSVKQIIKKLKTLIYEDRSYYMSFCAANMDDDATYLRLKAHEFVYTEPVINAVIMSPPYFSDIKANNDSFDCGSTAMIDISGNIEEDSRTATFSIDRGLSLGGKMFNRNLTMGASVSYMYKDTCTKESQYTFSTLKGQDSVLLTTIPLDIYYYEVLDPGAQIWRPLVIPEPCKPVQKIVDVNTYEKNLQKYNELVVSYNEKNENKLTKLPSLEKVVTHTSGDPESYCSKVADFQNVYDNSIISGKTMPINYGNSATTEMITIKNQSTNAYTYGGKFDIKTTKLIVAAGFNGSNNFLKSTSSYDGTSYRGELKGLPMQYQGKYSFEVALNAYTYQNEKKLSDVENNRFIVINYIVNHVEALPKLVDNFVAKEVGAHSVTLTWDFPGNASASLVASAYELYRYNAKEERWALLQVYDGNTPQSKGIVYVDEQNIQAATFYKYKIAAIRYENSAIKTNEKVIEVKTTKAPTYHVTYNAGTNGKVSAAIVTSNQEITFFISGKAIDEKVKLVFNAIPDEAYQVVGWKVEGMPEDEYKLSHNNTRLTIETLNHDIDVQPIYNKRIV